MSLEELQKSERLLCFTMTLPPFREDQARLFMLQDKSEIDVVGMTCWDGGRNYIITLSGPHNQFNNGIVRSYLMTFKLTSSPK
jgi:hypothetical protein